MWKFRISLVHKGEEIYIGREQHALSYNGAIRKAKRIAKSFPDCYVEIMPIQSMDWDDARIVDFCEEEKRYIII